jgi:hypothetical protein
LLKEVILLQEIGFKSTNKPERLFYKKLQIAEEFIIDETQIKVSGFRTTGFGWRQNLKTREF